MLFLYLFLFCVIQNCQEARENSDNLLPTIDAAKVRKEIYEGPFVIESDRSTLPPRRIVALPNVISTAYKKYPIGLSELLYKIIEGAEPANSHKAFIYLVILEAERSSWHELLREYDNYDKLSNNEQIKTLREFNLEVASRCLESIKEIHKNKRQ